MNLLWNRKPVRNIIISTFSLVILHKFDRFSVVNNFFSTERRLGGATGPECHSPVCTDCGRFRYLDKFYPSQQSFHAVCQFILLDSLKCWTM